MDYLQAIQKQTEHMVKELKWSKEEVDTFVAQVNKRYLSSEANSSVNNSLVYHNASYDGGFIVFGGWTNIYDHAIPSGTKGHHLYLAFGGLGAGGWKGDCNIELVSNGTFFHNGIEYAIPQFYYGEKNFDGYKSGFKWFHDNVKSFMYMYWPVFEQNVAVFVFFDGKSRRLGFSVPGANLSCGMGGGTVDVRSK